MKAEAPVLDAFEHIAARFRKPGIGTPNALHRRVTSRSRSPSITIASPNVSGPKLSQISPADRPRPRNCTLEKSPAPKIPHPALAPILRRKRHRHRHIRSRRRNPMIAAAMRASTPRPRSISARPRASATPSCNARILSGSAVQASLKNRRYSGNSSSNTVPVPCESPSPQTTVHNRPASHPAPPNARPPRVSVHPASSSATPRPPLLE